MRIALIRILNCKRQEIYIELRNRSIMIHTISSSSRTNYQNVRREKSLTSSEYREKLGVLYNNRSKEVALEIDLNYRLYCLRKPQIVLMDLLTRESV